MIRADLIRLLRAPVANGLVALVCGVIAVGFPTIIRLAVHGAVVGCEFTPYLPFVMGAAILMRWWQAALVALASVAVLGGAFGGFPSLDLHCFVPAAGIFLGSSAMIIGVVMLARHAFDAFEASGADGSGGIVFSVERGDVWASWHGQAPPVRLGSRGKVSKEMEEFLTDIRPQDPAA